MWAGDIQTLKCMFGSPHTKIRRTKQIDIDKFLAYFTTPN
jgi:hypothetical protein